MSTLLRARRILTATDDLHDGWLAVDDAGTVIGSGSGTPPRTETAVTIEGTVLPGAVDLHAHGALGHDFATASVDGAARAAGHHHARGTTSLVASVATGPVPETIAALRRLSGLVTAGTLAGLHLEGPWLSPARRGAHRADLLHAPDPAELDAFLTAADGALRIVTLAPELPGATDAVRHLVDAGVVVAIGHTDASADEVRAAIDEGAALVTHLFNGMPPLHHRRPGPVGVALTDDRVLVECIVDGHHLDPSTVELVQRAAPDRLVLVSDAMAATGCGDGERVIAGSAVSVRDGVALLADGSSLAGSTITVQDGARRLLDGGTPLPAVVAATSTRPARVLGLPAPLTVGAPADVVVIDEAPGTAVSSHGAQSAPWRVLDLRTIPAVAR
ncbi:N-acetylglucosamine-6-phosphate deacetylase [Curtobacterium sp. A7_M15]|uniref:N-acetylglucosamine-6-phosphate deacetylase n=1 Tax=Curtobacterium sp. A7_M15 TaxID=3065241 RepID=UPI002737B7B2|nr:N-acetylglucosamine-6-phosphate deacetylase [Curtobacterium sp. A7_M15]MDP4333005.1 N-acetylglucosamine-6-phosphate deacetylase [Curtobacterium sp. A7_M15]